MARKNNSRFILSTLFLIVLTACGQADKQTEKKADYLILVSDTEKDRFGYQDPDGELIVPMDKYPMCFTDTFRTYAIVLKEGSGFVAIDRNEKVMYEVFPFDNGPDYPSEGLFRIIKNNKIGYADIKTGEIVIQPGYTCAYPFENGTAKVSNNCKTESDGEHSSWISERWMTIDKNGEIIPETVIEEK